MVFLGYVFFFVLMALIDVEFTKLILLFLVLLLLMTII